MPPPATEQESGSVECREILRCIRHGAREPLLCRADDGACYVVKPYSAGGNWSLLMEWVGARLGRKLGLPIPNYRRVLIEETLAEAWNGTSPRQVEPGWGFGSQLIDNAMECTEALLAHLTPEMTRRVTAFDWWIRNRDRTLKNTNLLWNGGTRQIYAIDHDSAGGLAEEAELFWMLHLGAQRVPPAEIWLPPDLRNEFRQALSEREAIQSELPSAWTSHGEELASFFAQLTHTLDDAPHKDWRTYD